MSTLTCQVRAGSVPSRLAMNARSRETSGYPPVPIDQHLCLGTNGGSVGQVGSDGVQHMPDRQRTGDRSAAGLGAAAGPRSATVLAAPTTAGPGTSRPSRPSKPVCKAAGVIRSRGRVIVGRQGRSRATPRSRSPRRSRGSLHSPMTVPRSAIGWMPPGIAATPATNF